MPDWPGFLATETGQAILMGATALGTLFGAGWAAYKGVTQGRPAPSQTARAIASANCRIPDLDPQIRALAADLSALTAAVARVERDLDAQRETLIRIEDRTRGR
jgi:outer membrane murein-binding lipoprotein Lpp